MNSSPGATSRLFFALFPDDSVREQLLRIQQRIQPERGHATRAENLHLTLLFVGEVETRRACELQEIITHLEHLELELELDVFGSFGRAKKYNLWLGPSQPPEALLQWRKRLVREVGRLGLQIRRETFRPHVTLFRKASGFRYLPERLETALPWQIGPCTLVRSQLTPQGPIYEQLTQEFR